jgi:hypothetical protein
MNVPQFDERVQEDRNAVILVPGKQWTERMLCNFENAVAVLTGSDAIRPLTLRSELVFMGAVSWCAEASAAWSVRGARSNPRPLYVANCSANKHFLLNGEENGEPLASLGE